MDDKKPQPTTRAAWPLFAERQVRPLQIPFTGPKGDAEMALAEAEIAFEMCESWQALRQEVEYDELFECERMEVALQEEDRLRWN